MARMIKVRIDCAKIDKKRVKENGPYKNYEMILIETPGGKHGDWMVKEDRTKEEREARVKDTILGNGKNFGWGESKPKTSVSQDDLPY